MNCITWNHDRHSFWNCNSFDGAGLVTISLESKVAIIKIEIRQLSHESKEKSFHFFYSNVNGLSNTITSK